MDKKYTLVLVPKPSETHPNLYIRILNETTHSFYLTENINDATIFDSIGDAMRVSAYIYKNNIYLFKVFPIED